MTATDAIALFAAATITSGLLLWLKTWLGWQTLAWERPWDDAAGQAERNVARASKEQPAR